MSLRTVPCPLVAPLLLLLACPSCSSPAGGLAEGLERMTTERRRILDSHSFSRPAAVRVTHADIEWTVDFDARELHGTVTWTVAREPGAGDAPLILDTKGLRIDRVRAGRAGSLRVLERRDPTGEGEGWILAPDDHVLGRPLLVSLRPDDDRVAVTYRTTRDSAGLQWLDPEQTAGGSHPFLFTQAQAILARTFLPCQDTPGVRFTYSAAVQGPRELQAVMSAGRLPGGGPPWRFNMPQPIPSYLLAIAVGDLSFRPIGERTGVWAEPPLVERAAWEFADTERMMEAVEELYGPYLWDRFDVLVLPPSFPFGGMENPRMTFATPTILAGDRSLVALVAHELAHSWSGNLVTNASWADLWLNEGCTVYLERRIMEILYGRERAEMEAVLGRRDLLEDMQELEPRDTRLHVDLAGRDPDDAFSNVPYEKGYLLLRLLENTVGRERFDAFFQAWFRENRFESRSAADFERFLLERLFDGDRSRYDALRIDEWIHGPGLPDNAPEPSSPALDAVAAEARRFALGDADAAGLPAREWSFHEWLHFLRHLPEDLPAGRLAALDTAWSLTTTGNSEILCQWLVLATRTGYEPAEPAVEAFLTTVGRRKFLKPLYTALVETPAGRARALEIYEQAKPVYHAISRNTIEEILGLKEG